MRAPDFWYKPELRLCAAALSPFGALYEVGGRFRFAITRPYVAPVPVICVGNATAGGTGKTPFAITLAHGLSAIGYAPHIVTRGYGGILKGPTRVDPHHHTARQVGDEPLLLAAVAPVWIAKDRRAGVEEAIRAGADIIVMDDGLQNPSVAKTVSLVLIDGEQGVGNGRVMPAGPLRETLKSCLERADALVIMGKASERTRGQIENWKGPLFQASLEPDRSAPLAGPYIAFAGIARPEKFFATLDRLGVRLVERMAFADHHNFSLSEIERLMDRARSRGAKLITTAKDAVRLLPRQRAEIEVLPVVAVIAARETFGRFLIDRLASARTMTEKVAT